MRYGNPGMEEAYEDLLKRLPGLEEVTAIPLYPHYAMSSYETAVEHAKEVHQKKKYKFNILSVCNVGQCSKKDMSKKVFVRWC